jgi:hypothetical protein
MIDRSCDVPYGGVLRIMCLGNMISACDWRNVSLVHTWPHCITTRDLYTDN